MGRKSGKARGGLKKSFDLVDKLTSLGICGNLAVDFVAGVHNAGMVTATEKLTDFFEREIDFGEK